LAVLCYAGVRITDPQTGSGSSLEPIESGTGEQVAAAFDWSWVIRQLERPSIDFS